MTAAQHNKMHPEKDVKQQQLENVKGTKQRKQQGEKSNGNYNIVNERKKKGVEILY